MRKNILKILAILIAVAGIPVGIFLSRGLETPWQGNYVAVTSPSAIHWHVAIGIWIAFALVGLFIWCIDKLFVQKKSGEFVLAASVIMFVLGGLSGFLIGYRQGASSPWVPHGDFTDLVVISSAVEWMLTIVLWAVFFMLASILLTLALWHSKNMKSRRLA